MFGFAFGVNCSGNEFTSACLIIENANQPGHSEGEGKRIKVPETRKEKSQATKLVQG